MELFSPAMKNEIVISNKIHRIGDYVKNNKADSERQILHVFSVDLTTTTKKT
jgi:hypothetical protein